MGVYYMQTLKDELRNKIYSSAVEEFKQRGFKDASMRRIAKSSGMTVGNLYRYYKNKDALFDAVVENAYFDICSLIANHHDSSDTQGIEDFLNGMADNIVELFMKYRDELIILIECSEGTKYENIKEKFIKMMEQEENKCHDLTEELLLENGESAPKEEYMEFVLGIVARSFIEGLVTIFERYNLHKSKEQLKFFIMVLQKFCFSGLLGFEKKK
jgi:AcrR family transcriptional regulator